MTGLPMSRADSDAARRDQLLAMTPTARRKMLARMSERQRKALRTHWQVWAHPGQIAPEGAWHIWMIMAGRGFGKTRAGAEWVRQIAQDPGARIALVAASLGEARRVMVEGESGLMAISPRGKRPIFEPSRRQLTWASGAQATFYSAGEPESLRGPQHSHACGPGAKGVHRQRSAAARRSGLALHGRERSRGAACQPACGAGLAGGEQPLGRVRGARFGNRRVYFRRLALHRRSNRVARVRQDQRMFSPLHRFLAALCRACNAKRRHDDRSGSANRDR